jgi:DNA-binding MarR family transcriptional regulator
MTVNFEYENTILRLWLLIHRSYTLLRNCEDQVYPEHGLTTEQYGVLVTIKYLQNPVRITDVAQWMGRSTNSTSMIVDRMVKAGLVKRMRSKGDRRVVRVVNTSKGENSLKAATLAGWDFIQKIMSSLSHNDRRTLVKLLETLKYGTLNYLNPGEDVEEMVRDEAKRHANLMERLVQYTLPTTPKAKRQGGEKRKIKRKTE